MPHVAARWRFCAALALAALPLALASAAEAQSRTLLRLRSATYADRVEVDSSGTLLARGTFSSGDVWNPGNGPMLLWYPRKAAFRAGYAESGKWDDANVGNSSVATGAGTAASGAYSVAIGSYTTASGQYSTAMGRSTTASGYNATTMGANATASGEYAVAIGREVSATGDRSLAMGSRALTNGHAGAFIYGDASTSSYLSADAAHQATWRVSGGFRIYTNSTLSSGVNLAAGGSSWNTVSDRSRKEQFLAVDGEDVLARIATLPVSTWRYIAEQDREVRHIGPMAQDWKRAFGFSADSTTINSGDFDGVNLAAVQALARRTESLRSENEALRAAVAALQARNDALEARLQRLERGAPAPR